MVRVCRLSRAMFHFQRKHLYWDKRSSIVEIVVVVEVVVVEVVVVEVVGITSKALSQTVPACMTGLLRQGRKTW